MKKRADLELFALGLLVLVVAIIIPTVTESCSNNGFGQFCTQTIYTYDGVSASTAKAILFVVAALCIAGGVILLILRNKSQKRLSTGQSLSTITVTPPVRNDVPASTPSPQRSNAGMPLEGATRPKRRTRLLVIVGSIILVLAIAGVWIGLGAQTSSSGFQQDATIGSHITSITVGTAIGNSGLQGQGETFQGGSPSCISLTVHNDSSPAYIDAVLFQGNNTFFSGSVVHGLLPYYQGNLWICSSYNVLDPGVYKWVVNFNGSAEASITFQIVS
jgi:hypothetical protein